MNPCTEPNSETLLHRYVQGKLSEIDARRYEEHFFECPACLTQVESLQAVARKLAADRVPLPARVHEKKPFVMPYRAMGSIAAALVVTCLVFFLARRVKHSLPARATATPATPAAHRSASTSKADSAMVALADFSMPPFQPARLRGMGDNADFAAAMEAYSKHDCEGALTSLARVPPDDRAATAAHFYTVICEMQQRDLGAAYGSLSRVAYAVDTPQQEAAFYYLAQVEIARGDFRSAQADLVQTVIQHGEFEQHARTELNEIRAPQSAPVRIDQP
jgi:anti-sigma factor RsiW